MKLTTISVALGLIVVLAPISLGAVNSKPPVTPRPVSSLVRLNDLNNPKLSRSLAFRLEENKIPRILTLRAYTAKSGVHFTADKTYKLSFTRFRLSNEIPPKPIDFSQLLLIRSRKIEALQSSQGETTTPQPKKPNNPDQSKPQPPKAQPQPPKPPAEPTTITYTVKAGDQLGLIAYQYSTTVAEIMRLNSLSSPDLLFVGQKLIIQGTPRQIPNPYQNGATKGGSAVAAHWDFVNLNFPIGAKATVTDLATGISYQVVRMSGFLHADVEPVTAADTANMNKIYSNRWSWAFRPVVVTVNGHRFAASINGMPHDIQTISNNNFPGHSCIHFMGSKNHFNQQEEPNHQANVLRAVGK